MEPMLTFMSSENLTFLKNQVGVSFALHDIIECISVVGLGWILICQSLWSDQPG